MCARNHTLVWFCQIWLKLSNPMRFSNKSVRRLAPAALQTAWRHQGAWERVLPRRGSARKFASLHELIGGAELTFWSAAACL